MNRIRNGSNSGNKFVTRRLLMNKGSVIVKSAPPPDDAKSKLRIHHAKQDIKYLKLLSGYPGIPVLLSECNNNGVEYVVEDISGFPLCHDYYGTTEDCLSLIDLKMKIVNSGSGMEKNMWTFILNFASLFHMLHRNGLWLEDMSGSNIIVTNDFDIYLVDLDSLRKFQPDIPCSTNSECTKLLNSNLWSINSLNHKISWTCNDVKHMCSNHCKSLSKLSVCQFGNWILKSLSIDIPEMNSHTSLAYLRKCSTSNKCNFETIISTARENIEKILPYL